MYLILICAALGAAVTGTFYALGMVGFDEPGPAFVAVLSFVLTFAASFALLGRRFTKGLEVTMKSVEKHLGQRKFDLALKTLLDAQKRYHNWHPLVGRQIAGQVGQLLYIQGKFAEAIPYLEKALRWDWTAQTMLGCAHHKAKDTARMIRVLQATAKVRTARKEPLFWTVYAYLLRKNGKKDEAVRVLEKAVKALPEEKRLQNSLQALRGNKRMKVNVYGPAWQQFRL